MRTFFIHNRRGITLIEVIVVITLIAVIMLPISTFLINNYKLFNKTEKRIDAQQQAQYAMNLLITRAMEAKSMKIPDDTSNIDFEFDLGDSKKWIFKYDARAKVLFSNDDKGNTNSEHMRAYAENISALNVEKINGQEAVRFTIGSKLGNETINITNEVSFRNR